MVVITDDFIYTLRNGINMTYKIEFEIAAAILVLVLLLFYYPQKNFPSLSNRVYKTMLFFAFFTDVVDIISCWVISVPGKFSVSFIYIINGIYLLFQNSMSVVFFVYILSMVKFRIKENRGRIIILAIPYIFSTICIILSPITKHIYKIDETGRYSQGKLMPLVYIFAVGYMLMSVYVTIRYIKRLTIRQIISVYIFVTLTIAAIIIQYVTTYLLITGFASACSCLVMYIMLQNPNESVERDTGLFTREAFIMSLNDSIKRKKAFCILLIIPDSLSSINNAFGFDKGTQFIKSVGEYLIRLLNGPVYRIENKCIGMLVDTSEEEGYISQIQERFKKSWRIGNMDINRTCSICSVLYPDSANSMEELLDNISYVISEVRKLGKGSVFYAKDMIPSKGQRLTELERQSRFLEEESREAYRAKDEAERADHEKSMFLANMSHEIRTPMNAIIGMTELILKDDINDRVRANANDIKGAGAALLAIINDVLDISKIESGKMEIRNAEYDLNAVITDIVNMLSTRIKHPDVEFIVDIDMKLPRKLYGDEIRLKQVLINLLNNAAKFTEKGYVKLRIRGDEDGDRLMLRADVEDSGCGIRQSDINKLFNSFTRIDSGNNRYIEGTGLGLALCRKILLYMNGDISVNSQYGVGSTFSFQVPQKAVSKERIGETAIDIAKQSAIVIGDETDKGISRLMTELSSLGLKFDFVSSEAVNSGSEADGYTYAFTTKAIYKQYGDRIRSSGNPEIILIAEQNRSYEDTPEVKLLNPPIYTLNIIRAMEMRYTEQKGRYVEAWHSKTAKILIVDDNPVNLKVISGLLKCYAIVADTALSGQEAIEAVKKKQYDVIFMDHMMPVMDGIETMHRIRALKGYYEKVPIVAVTANAVHGVRESFLREGFTEYISKPIAIDRLEEVLLRQIPTEKLEYTVRESEKAAEELSVPHIDGLDTQAGVELCGGNVGNYIELLKIAYRSGINQLEVLQKSYEEHDIKNYIIEVHALKSVAATLGERTLSAMAKEQELHGRSGDVVFLEEHAEEIVDSYRTLLNNIRKYLNY